MTERYITQSRTAWAGDISPSQLAQWIKADLPVLDAGRDHLGPGKGGRLLSPHSVLQLAFGRQMVAHGVAPRAALLMGVSLVGTNRSFGPTLRPCGDLWRDGETLGVFAPATGESTFIRAESLGDGMTWGDVMSDVALGEPGGVIVLSATAVRDEVARRLGVAPHAFLLEGDAFDPIAHGTDALGRFLRRNCAADPEGAIPLADLHRVARRQYGLRGDVAPGEVKLGLLLQERGLGPVTDEGGPARVSGLRWRDAPGKSAPAEIAGPSDA